MTLTRESMQKSRYDTSSVWQEYTLHRQRFDGYFAFFEGDDGKYYNQRLENQLNKEFNKYKCNSKKNVIELWSKIRHTATGREMYFIDKDYNYSHSFIDNNIFQTEGYSVENYYTSTSSFEKLLMNEVGLNRRDQALKEYTEKYDEVHREFRNILTDYNLFSAGCIHESLSVDLSKIKIFNFIQVELDKVVIKERFDFNTIIDYYEKILLKQYEKQKKYSVENLENFQKSKSNLEDFYTRNKQFFEKHIDSFTRGKEDLEFLNKYIEKFKEANKNRELDIFYPSVHINPSSNPLSTLTNYADTTKKLKHFLEKFKDEV